MTDKKMHEAAKLKADRHLQIIADLIEKTSEDIVPLYDDIENYFFQDIDYQKIKALLPVWVMDAGRCPESDCGVDLFRQLHSELNDQITNRCLHWFDLQSVIGAMQDRICAITEYLYDLSRIVPLYSVHEAKDYSSCQRFNTPYADKAHMCINLIFATMNSALDLFAKIMYECHEYDSGCHIQYGKLKSRNCGILFRGCEKRMPKYKGALSGNRLVFSKPLCIEKMYSYRDEYIHNGFWDYRCSIYQPCVQGVPVECFILAPDMTVAGNFCSEGGRNKFYSSNEKINVTIMPTIEEWLHVIGNSVLEFRKLLVADTKVQDKKVATDDYCRALINYKKSILARYDTLSIEFLKNSFPALLAVK